MGYLASTTNAALPKEFAPGVLDAIERFISARHARPVVLGLTLLSAA
jgi:hypothetical protein